jgi:hypothetical protein
MPRIWNHIAGTAKAVATTNDKRDRPTARDRRHVDQRVDGIDEQPSARRRLQQQRGHHQCK